MTRPGMGAVAVGAVALAILGLASPPSAAAPSGSISGRVVDGNGVPLPGICVNVENGPGTLTSGSGAYSLPGVAGSVKVRYSDCNPAARYVTQWYLHHWDQGSADLVTVADGVDTPLPDVRMDDGVSVSGTVTDGAGSPIPGISVAVNPSSPGLPMATTQTDATGHYTTAPLPSGDYNVGFSDDGPTPTWGRQFWNQKPSWNAADLLRLDTGSGSTRAGIDARLEPEARISGTVTGPGGIPLSDVCVDANAVRDGGHDFVEGARTASDGTYTIGRLPAADLRVHFRDCNPGSPYLEQWFDAAGDADSSTPVVVAPGDHRQGVDAQLAIGVAVVGRVTDESGAPLAGINVSVNPMGPGNGAGGQTDADGRYRTNAVAPGDYRVQFAQWAPNPAFATQYWNAKYSWSDADILTITPADGAERNGINASLTAGATISGRVTTPAGTPAGGICVDAVVGSARGKDGVASTTTAGDGTYTLGGLPATAVKVVFRDCNRVGPYLQQWWNNRPDSASAEALPLTAGSTRSGIDARLAAASAITGTVTDDNGHPLEGICAQATTASFVGDLARTDSSGRYMIVLAVPGDYRVQFVDCTDAPTHAGQWWQDQPTPATATAVSVGGAEVVGGIDARLHPGAVGSISGRVVNLNGVPMTTACVVAYLPFQYVLSAPVNPDGTYAVENVPSGTYALAFVACDGEDAIPVVPSPESPGTDYASAWWDGPPIDFGDEYEDDGPDPIAQGATLVTVPPGQHLTDHDRCFGCTAISITGITAGSGAVSITFETPGLVTAVTDAGDRAVQAAALSYSATCTSSTGGASGSASGTTAGITVDGLTQGATYTCQVTASDGRVTVAASAVSGSVMVPAPPAATPTPAVVADPVPTAGSTPTTTTTTTSTPPAARAVAGIPTSATPAKLAVTGGNSATKLALCGLALLGLGLVVVASVRWRRRDPSRALS